VGDHELNNLSRAIRTISDSERTFLRATRLRSFRS
jgi:hypothetical protein